MGATNKTRSDEMRPVCIQRTADAVAESHAAVTDLERRVLIMIKELNDHQAKLHEDLALLTLNVGNLVPVVEKNSESLEELTRLANSSDKRLVILESWVTAADKRRLEEEQEKRDARKPWVTMAFSLLEKIVWAAATGVIAYLLYKINEVA